MFASKLKYSEFQRFESLRSFFSSVMKFYSITIGIFALSIVVVPSAWAVQSHAGTEGLVSHQIGHFLFVIGMGSLLLRLNFMQIKGDGWFEFKSFLWLLLAWNIMTFAGHWMNAFVAEEKFLEANSRTISFTIENFQDALYYCTRFDHLILVPSFAFLLAALRKWSRQQ